MRVVHCSARSRNSAPTHCSSEADPRRHNSGTSRANNSRSPSQTCQWPRRAFPATLAARASCPIPFRSAHAPPDHARLHDWPARVPPGGPTHRLVRALATPPRSSSKRGRGGGGVRSRPGEGPPFCLDRALKKTERSEEHTSELQSPDHLVCPLLLEKKK